MEDKENYCWCHRNLEEDKFDCGDYMDCTECPHYNNYEEDA